MRKSCHRNGPGTPACPPVSDLFIHNSLREAALVPLSILYVAPPPRGGVNPARHTVIIFVCFFLRLRVLQNMFMHFRRRLAAAKGTEKALRDIADILHEVSGRVADRAELVDRIEELELSRAKWEAELEGLLMKADSKLKASNNAEARTRVMKKSYESFADEGLTDRETEIAQEVFQHIPDGNVAPSRAEPMPAMLEDVAQNDKAAAVRMKFS